MHIPDEFATWSAEETESFGCRIGALLESGPNVLALSGDLGSGKTALVRGICRYFRCEEQVSSPTFTIINEYRGSKTVFHCDLYRTRHEDELFEAGVEELLRQDDIVLVEWGERAATLLPLPRFEILADHGASEQERRFRFRRCMAETESILQAPKEFFALRS